MQLTTDLPHFLQRPVDRAYGGRRFLFWCADATCWGCIYWGQFSKADAEELVTALDAELGPDVPVHPGLADFRRLERPDPDAFGVLERYLSSRRDELGRRITRQAILHDTNMIGAIVAGFYRLFVPAHPYALFTDPAAALEWLGPPYDASLVARAEALAADVTELPNALRRLRALLAESPAEATIDAAAKALGVSRRTLQRQLQQAGTTFQQELGHARVRAAQAQLLASDVKVTAVAIEVGCASLQHFASLFRRITGQSPSEWRERQRGRARQP